MELIKDVGLSDITRAAELPGQQQKITLQVIGSWSHSLINRPITGQEKQAETSAYGAELRAVEKKVAARMHRDKAAKTIPPLKKKSKRLLLINHLLESLSKNQPHSPPLGPTTPTAAVSAPSTPHPAALEQPLENDTHSLFAQPTCHVALFPPFPRSHCPRKAGYSDSFLSIPQQNPLCSRCSLPSASPWLMNTSLSPLGKKFLVVLQ